MTVDTSMYGNIKGPDLMSPAQAVSLQNVAQQGQLQRLQIQDAEQNQVKKNMLREVLQGATDPKTGRLTPDGLAKITALDPSMGLDLGKQQEQLRLQDVAFNEKKDGIKRRVGQSYVESYDRYLQQTGGNKEQAKMLAQKEALSVIDELEGSGTLAANGMDSASAAKLRSLPEPEQARALVRSLGGEIKELVPGQRQERKRIDGLNEVQEVWDPETKSWKEIGKGPRFAPNAALIKLDQPVVGDYTKTGEEFLTTIPADKRSMVKKIANYEVDPKTMSSLGGHREQLVSMASQYNPEFDQKEYNSRFQAVNKFNTGPQGNTVRSLGVAIEHMDTARKLGAALQNSDVPAFNKLAQAFAEQTGKPAPTNFDAVKEIVADEVIKGVIGGSGALADREAAAQKIKRSSSPAQMAEVFDSWTKLLAGQVEGLKTQYESSTGRKDFETKLTPRAREALAAVSGGDVKGKVEAAGWKYEPDQYDYRVGEGGKVQRKKK